MTLRHTACITLLMALCACSQRSENAERAEPAAADIAEARPQSAPMVAAPAAPPPPPLMRERTVASDAVSAAVTAVPPAAQLGSSAAVYEDGQRRFIRTASARFAVKDVYAAALGIEDTVAAHGGFVASNSIGTETLSTSTHRAGKGKLIELTEYAVQGKLVLRVPSAKTQEFLRAIVRHIQFLDERHFAARDAQFDLLRQQLDAIRSQETQAELAQAIGAGGKLGQREQAIGSRNAAKAARDDAIIARKTMEDQIAFSTITLDLHQPSRVLQAEKIDVESVVRDHRPGFIGRLGEGLASGWDSLLNVVLALAAAWPLVLAMLAGAALLWRARRARRPAAGG